MQAQQIVNQLKAVLPKYTNDFTTNVAVSSLTRSGDVVTVTSSSSHGLIAGNKVLISGAKTPITIASLTCNGKYALAITATKHNLVKNQPNVEISGADQAEYNGVHKLIWEAPAIYIASIEISGTTATITTTQDHGLVDNANVSIEISNVSPSEYNGVFSIDSIINSTTFTITIEGVDVDGQTNGYIPMQFKQLLNAYTFIYEITGSPASPATGSLITQIHEYNDGYNGYKIVDSVIDANTFTYTIDSEPNSPAQGNILFQAAPTITGAIDYDRAAKFYESACASGQSKKWIVVVLDNETTNKNNFNKSDSVSYNSAGLQIREQSFQNVTLYVFLPCGATNDELLYIVTRDAGASYKKAIYRAILGFKPSSDLVEDFYSKLTPIGNGAHAFTGSYYVHYYTFQASCWANSADALDVSDEFAFREFDLDALDNDDAVVMNIAGSVDEQPA